MKRSISITGAVALAIALFGIPAAAQHSHGGERHGGPHLHVNPRWKECSIQLDAALTQSAWRQFTEEAGLVVYFRPLTDARPMGKGKFELSLVQWQTGIDDSDSAWNDTFVHPDSAHSLFEGEGLKFPGLMVRAGVTGNTDVGLYLTKNPGANYGFFGGQVQRSFLRPSARGWAAAARVSFVSLYGPDDVDFTVYGADVLASKAVPLTGWATLSPYAGASTYLATSHEKSDVVQLDDEHVLGVQATMGVALQLSKARLAVEYNAAKVGTLSMKFGFGI